MQSEWPIQRRIRRLVPDAALALRLASCFGSVVLSIVLVSLFDRDSTGNNIVWVANGLLLSYLLLAPRWRWPLYLAAGAAALIAGSALIHEPLRLNLLFNLLNLVEIVAGALLIRRKSIQLPNFTDGRYLLRFLAYCVLFGPLLSASILALLGPALWGGPRLPYLTNWLTPDALGTAVAAPTCVAILQRRLRAKLVWQRHWIHVLAVATSTVAVFQYAPPPLLFLLYPVLILVLLELGLGWAATTTLFMALVGGWFTIRGIGPLGGYFASWREPSLFLQLFLACGVLMLYSVSVVLQRQQAAERKLTKIARLHELLTQTSRDEIVLADFQGNRSYVSAASEQLVGMRPEELIRHSLIDVAHPEDRQRIRDVLQRLQAGEENALIEYRVRQSSGNYIWVESNLRAIRGQQGAFASGVMTLIRDITERKRVEAELREAYKIMEGMAAIDALTGTANRRRFDEYLAAEWQRGMRDRTPLSVVLFDVDFFKRYNDAYGHLQGDNCLKTVVQSILEVVTRPADLAARFGGEEFAVVLPNTPLPGALKLARRAAEALQGRSLVHSESPFGIVTISAGCATLVPCTGCQPPELVEMADRALYEAKGSGRNQVRAYNSSSQG